MVSRRGSDQPALAAVEMDSIETDRRPGYRTECDLATMASDRWQAILSASSRSPSCHRERKEITLCPARCDRRFSPPMHRLAWPARHFFGRSKRSSVARVSEAPANRQADTIYLLVGRDGTPQDLVAKASYLYLKWKSSLVLGVPDSVRMVGAGRPRGRCCHRASTAFRSHPS
jgi:hypothetical protein